MTKFLKCEEHLAVNNRREKCPRCRECLPCVAGVKFAVSMDAFELAIEFSIACCAVYGCDAINSVLRLNLTEKRANQNAGRSSALLAVRQEGRSFGLWKVFPAVHRRFSVLLRPVGNLA